MVNFALSFTIAFSLFISQYVIAAPSTASVTASPAVASRSGSKDTTRFSFADWVDTIIANPETALKPREAVQAFIDSMNATESANSNGLDKRWDSKVECGKPGDDEWFARATDAAFCVNYIASMGQEACPAVYYPDKRWVWHHGFCGSRTASIAPFGPWAEDATKYGSCQSVAQTAGIIMDTCTSLRGSVNLVVGKRPYGLTGTTAGVQIYHYDAQGS